MGLSELQNKRKTWLHGVACVCGVSALLLPMPAISAPSSLVTIPQVEGRGYILTASLTTQANSNFFRPITGDEASVVLIAPNVEAGIGLPVGRQQFFIGGSLGRDIFIDNSELNRNRVRAGGGVNLRAGSRCEGSVAGEFASFQNLLADVAEIVDNVQEQLTAGASFNCQGTIGLGFGGTAQYLKTRNQRPGFNTFNFDSFTISPQISYASPSIGIFSLGASFQNVKYPDRQVLTLDGPVDDGFDVRSVRLGFSRDLGTRFNVRAGVSSVRVSPKPPSVVLLLPDAVPGEDGLTPVLVTDRAAFTTFGYDGALTLQLADRARITASTSRAAFPIANLGALSAVRNNHSIDVDIALRRGLNAGVGGALSNTTYRGSFVTPDQPIPRTSDRIQNVYASLTYSPRRRFSVGVEVAHQKRVSNPDILSFSNTSALLRLRYSIGRSR
jgi:hypothetical protein